MMTNSLPCGENFHQNSYEFHKFIKAGNAKISNLHYHRFGADDFGFYYTHTFFSQNG